MEYCQWNKVTDIARTTAEYMSHLEAAPHLTANGLEGDYRLLADFNGVVLAGHPTQYGAQFVTWERSPDQTSLGHGHYYGPNAGVDSYTATKQDFAVRSDLIPRSAFFTPEQLAESIAAFMRHWKVRIPLQTSGGSACSLQQSKLNTRFRTWRRE